jgi:hypothetical protein
MAAAVDMFVGMSAARLIVMMSVHVIPMLMLMCMRVFVLVRVLVGVFVLVLVFVRVGVLMGIRVVVPVIATLLPVLLVVLVGVLRAFVNPKLDSTHALPLFAIEVHMKIAEIQFRELPFEGRRFDPKIDQGANGHVTADAGRTIQIKNAHG